MIPFESKGSSPIVVCSHKTRLSFYSRTIILKRTLQIPKSCSNNAAIIIHICLPSIYLK